MSSATAKRSVAPPCSPEKAIWAPSGDQVGVKISSTVLTGISRDIAPDGMSKIVSIAVPSRTVASTNWRPVRSHAPAESMN